MTSLARHPCRIAIWTALLAAGVLGPAAVGATEEIVIPSETCRGLWVVPVSFGSDPERVLRLMLDTGASYTSVDPDAIDGTPIYERGCVSSDDDPDGDGVVISVVRDGERFDMTLVSRVLVP